MTLSILLSLFTSLFAQPDTSIHTTVEAQAIVSDVGVTPYFLSRLQYGSVPLKNPGLVLRAWNGKSYNFKKKYDWKYEVEATGWTGIQNDLWLTQAYVSGRRGKWELWAGRRKEVYGLGDTAMTSGFYAWSGNAVPMPKIQFGTRDYIDFAKGHLGVFMTFAHGWLDNQGPVLNGLLHQKSLYGRIGRKTALLNLYGGINHQVMWSGISTDGTTYGTGLNTFYYVITTSKKRDLINEDPNAPATEIGYQYGAHCGSIDLLLKLKPRWGTFLVYKQTAYETGRIARLITANDGISGISLHLNKSKVLQMITFEYIYTANQGQFYSGIAKLLKMKDPHADEIENNFNGTHGGWHYLDRGIGTPLIIYDMESKNRSGYGYSFNAVKAYYLGLKGYISNDLTWKLRASYSLHTFPRYQGFNIKDFDGFIPQTSLGFEVSKRSTKYSNVYAELAYDRGERVLNSLGINIGLKIKIN